MEQPAVVKQLLADLQSPQQKAIAINTVPDAAVDKADAGILAKLKAANVLVLPVTQSSNYLMVSFITDTVVKADVLKDLQQLSKQIVWLKLANTTINDAIMQAVAQLIQLTSLDLSNTKITDAGLKRTRISCCCRLASFPFAAIFIHNR